MPLDHLTAPRSLLQSIDILRNCGHQSPELFQSRQRVVRRVRISPAKSLPAKKRARPVALTRSVAGDKIMEFHGLLVFPLTVSIAVSGPQPPSDPNALATLLSEEEGEEVAVSVRYTALLTGTDTNN